MVIARATQIGVVEERRLPAVFRSGFVALLGEKGGDAFVCERADFEGAGRNRLGARRIEAAIKTQNSKASAEALFGMWPAGEHGRDQPLGVGSDLAGPAAEPIWRPIGVTPVGTGHVIRVGAVPGTDVTPLMHADALATMEDLDDAGGDPHIDLGANERVRNRVKELVDFDVIIEIDARASPLRELPIGIGQPVEGIALDLFEQLATTDAELAHGTIIHALDGESDGGVAFGERKEGLTAQSPENVCLRSLTPASTFALSRGL